MRDRRLSQKKIPYSDVRPTNIFRANLGPATSNLEEVGTPSRDNEEVTALKCAQKR